MNWIVGDILNSIYHVFERLESVSFNVSRKEESGNDEKNANKQSSANAELGTQDVGWSYVKNCRSIG